MKNLFFKIVAFVVCFLALANSSMQAQRRTKMKDVLARANSSMQARQRIVDGVFAALQAQQCTKIEDEILAQENSSMQPQQRTKIKDGVYLVSYGNTFVVEDDINQRSIQLRVDRKQDNSGRPVYDILCGNKVTKAIAQTALKGAIRYALVQTGVAAWVTPYATTIAGLAYDAVCEYYK